MPRRTVADYDFIHQALKAAFESVDAPIMDLIAAQTHDPYKILVGTILSARTKDGTTAAAIGRLFPVAPDLASLDRLDIPTIEKLIFPVGFYHDKARHLKALPEAVNRLYGGVIPHTVEELTELPGVGRKTANLLVALAFHLPAICVDTHVHRINNRLGIVKTKTPLETEMALRKCLPERLWIDWNAIFVSFGQTRCRPIGPHCEGCPIAQYCLTPGGKDPNAAKKPTAKKATAKKSAAKKPAAKKPAAKKATAKKPAAKKPAAEKPVAKKPAAKKAAAEKPAAKKAAAKTLSV